MELPGGSLATVTDQIRQGYANGHWNNSGGIVSSSAAADSTHLPALGVIQNNQGGTTLFATFDTYAVGASDILVKYTYYGDANLDGKVDGSDYSKIDSSYASEMTSGSAISGCFNGNFNYDGVVDGSDYALIDNAFNSQGAQLSTAIATEQIAGNSAVPEPCATALVPMTIGLLRRRRGVD